MLIPATNKVTKFSTSFIPYEDELRLFSWVYDANKAIEMAFCTGYFNDELIIPKIYDNVIKFNYASR